MKLIKSGSSDNWFKFASGEEARDAYREYVQTCGCENCVNRGDNGCGIVFFPDRSVFRVPDEEEGVEGWEWTMPAVTQEIGFCCTTKEDVERFKAEDEQHKALAEKKREFKAKTGLAVFELAIETALEKAPNGAVCGEAYGSIVRSAAAIAVSVNRSIESKEN